MKKFKKKNFWTIVGKVALVVGLLAGLTTILQPIFSNKSLPSNTTHGDQSPNVVSDEGDVNITFGVENKPDSTSRSHDQ